MLLTFFVEKNNKNQIKSIMTLKGELIKFIWKRNSMMALAICSLDYNKQ